jgi:1-deoxy-D-xylulose 5-phosphate reductoisomerase
MAKTIKVWSGSEWVDVGVQAALPSDYVDTASLNSTLSSYKQEVNLAISADTTLVAGRRYFVDTAAARTLTLPASPTLGQEIIIFDATGSAGTNNITLSRNGNKINGLTEDAIIDVDKSAAVLIYTGSTIGWRLG